VECSRFQDNFNFIVKEHYRETSLSVTEHFVTSLV